MNAYQLADYLISHASEIIIVNREYEYVQEAMRDGEMPEADLNTILEALEIANSDPYITEMAELFNQGA